MRRKGYTLIELSVVMAVIVVIGVFVVLSLSGRKKEFEVRTVAQQIATILREAQSKSMSQASSTVWGVHFDNTATSSGTYTLFASSTYSSAAQFGNAYRLPAGVVYDTSTVPAGGTLDVSFSQIIGTASASTSVRIYIMAIPTTSSTIRVSSSGLVSY